MPARRTGPRPTKIGNPCGTCGGTLRYLDKGRCVTCCKADYTERNAANREARREYDRLRRQQPETIAREKAWSKTRVNTPKRQADRRRNLLRRKYNLTFESYNRMLMSQSKTCAICDESLPVVMIPGRAVTIDHDHATGTVRGLLCNNCNLMLGHARDNQDILLNAITYLQASAL